MQVAKVIQATTNMSVWTEWLDIFPVVGTLQNTVEAISAVCHGAYDLAKENGADAALSLVLDVLTYGTAGAPDSAHLKVAEKVVMKGIGPKEVMNAMKGKGGKSGKGGAAQSMKGAGKKTCCYSD
ncbi:uncharacterized protein LOC124261695 [Haliotis rubra]|uniref:uncharacterized protein LOC124261695 n=1 Tax=Haliotis rubra TaxID=36100 RepID=UPI001EE504DF|nr:uncharacterized protein LOC124261695 [Haliotis rubra]